MEAIKNKVSAALGHNKEDTTTSETSQTHPTGHHEQGIGGTTATSTTGDSTTATGGSGYENTPASSGTGFGSTTGTSGTGFDNTTGTSGTGLSSQGAGYDSNTAPAYDSTTTGSGAGYGSTTATSGSGYDTTSATSGAGYGGNTATSGTGLSSQGTGYDNNTTTSGTGLSSQGGGYDSNTAATGITGSAENPSVHDQITSSGGQTSQSYSAVDTGAPSHHDHHDRFPEGSHSHHQGQHTHDTVGGVDARGTHDHHQGQHVHQTEGSTDTSGTHGHHEHHEHHEPHKSHETEDGKRIQSPDQGPDPALVGDSDPSKKLTGTGEPGSHSALFGLTPDGKKHTETSKGSGAPVAAHSKDSAVGGGKQSTQGDEGSRGVTGGNELKEQMHAVERDPGNKGGQRTDPVPLSGEGGGAVAGAGGVGGSQGTGQI
ncbi:hypothetical protein H2200_007588 [Cladophialophora chaetospira]|uniref:Uncharacterized protein n=1 Tax=Cladophialophora chaetospira TaxID=386627 RepID=A0AA39CGR3_9EURO|nr:hypothetical protein H2200_007588 [Cladophialophora chaetospira]